MSWGDNQERTPANARVELIDYLNSKLTEPVGSWYPSDATPDVPQIPYVAVANDGGPGGDAVHMNTTLRVTVWHQNPTPAFSLAALCHGVLTAFAGSATIDTVRAGIGISEAVDDRTGHNLASFTVIAAARLQ